LFYPPTSPIEEIFTEGICKPHTLHQYGVFGSFRLSKGSLDSDRHRINNALPRGKEKECDLPTPNAIPLNDDENDEEMKHSLRSLMLVVNALWMALVLFVLFFVFIHFPKPINRINEIRLKIATSSSLEDLRPRTEHAINALEHAESVVDNLRVALIRISIIGVLLSGANIAAFFYFSRKQINDSCGDNKITQSSQVIPTKRRK
jgi:flagellar basal body-associated protein FliL